MDIGDARQYNSLKYRTYTPSKPQQPTYEHTIVEIK